MGGECQSCGNENKDSACARLPGWVGRYGQMTRRRGREASLVRHSVVTTVAAAPAGAAIQMTERHYIPQVLLMLLWLWDSCTSG